MPFWKRKKKLKMDAPLGRDRAAFVAALRARLDAAGEPYRYDADAFAIFGEGSGGVHFLTNAYDEYAARPAEERPLMVAEVVRRVQTPFPTAPDTWAEAQANIMPRLRDLAYYTNARLQIAHLHPDTPPPTFCHQPFAPGMALEAVYDLPTQMMAVTNGQQTPWGVDTQTVIDTALANLAVRTGDCFEAVAPGFYVCTTGDAYDSSRMALIDRIRALPVEGPHLAVAPHRDVLFITGAADPANRARLLQAVQQNLEAPRLQTFVPFVLEADGWQRWSPAEDDPLASEWKMLDVQYFGRNYADLKRLLDQTETRFVAKYTAIKTGAGEILSYCVWPPVAGAWLPRTELVSVMDFDNPGEPEMLPWDAIADQVRPVPDVSPPVFETLRDGDAAFVAALKG